MRFNHFELLRNRVLEQVEADPSAKEFDGPPQRLHPLVLAYIGDAFFALYVRNRLLNYEQGRVRVLHNFSAKMVSATSQANALRLLEPELNDAEIDIVRRGRNAKSTVPKSASVADYRYSTGFEALLGYLYLNKNYERLSEIAEKSFAIISREMTK
ncbi:ribonuclease-3 family protein [Anaerospora hongkongensis]|uniref:Mini-ribonuclease 3 n=1 Tax=Anaerospora hongkongensis TaxID=244830 RepID=A0A4R1PMB6_9FIRM|nr:ribonuclease III domain-containing protein [Anaerospora hongkongensis]TCL32408.1 ribonuclease-3 family protein [Anaerospora hongkongensis]